VPVHRIGVEFVKVRNRIAIVAAAVTWTGAAAWAVTRLSPWPSALLIRRAFDAGGRLTATALAKHVPPGIAEQRDLRYDAARAGARLDVFHPAALDGTDERLATVVWIHGGGFVSGSKDHVANYLRIIAGQGYTTVGVDYSVAPRACYPTPVREVVVALGYLVREADRLHVDPARIILAGDSAGAHIAAQVALIVSSPGYAATLGIAQPLEAHQLVGVVLHCGPFDFALVDGGGRAGPFVRSVLWAYLGTKAFEGDPRIAEATIGRHVTAAFPPTFISVGDADPLAPHSVELVSALSEAGVPVEALFFPLDGLSGLGHEYQFDLDGPAGQLALERMLGFLGRVGGARPSELAG
jgi:acetyl esterase/lipase